MKIYRSRFYTHRSSLYFFIGLVVVFLGLWCLFTLNSWSIGRTNHKLKGIGTLLGIGGYAFLSISLFLSSRWNKLEDWFGGLDQIYHIHRSVGILGTIFILLHPLILAVRWLPQRWDRFFLFFLPAHSRVSVNLGVYAFWLMILILVITFFKLLSYDKWKITHKLMSLVFILASLHFLFSDRLFGPSIISKIWLCIPMTVGFFSIIYKQIYHDFLKKYPVYEVLDTKKINENVIEIILQPKQEKLTFDSGQYAFFSFQGENLSQEFHPFTLLGNSENGSISIIAKARGDFTKVLYDHIISGRIARIDGPYGRLNFRSVKPKQIWIAGGIGIALFLAWIRDLLHMESIEQTIDLFYAMHSEQDAIFLDECEQISKKFPQFRFFCFCSESHNRLDLTKIIEASGSLNDKSILMCGPKKMTQDLMRQLLKADVKRENILFEDFEFF